MQGGTTSRVNAAEFLPAIAYLASRLHGNSDELCDASCVRLNQQVSDAVKDDIAVWFVSMGLSKKGIIEDNSSKNRSCTIAKANHGKAFELLGTAMYHALYEFGDKVGIDSTKYEILLSDPQKNENRIEVGLMVKSPADELVLHEKKHRKPDLVLEGAGVGKRIWIEFKSWAYEAGPFKKAVDVFDQWDGLTGATSQYTNASRQYFLDTAASQNFLKEPYWNKQSEFVKKAKPSEHLTWFHVWEAGKRRWRALVKENGKYTFEDKYTVAKVSTPWISSEKLITNNDLGEDEPFQEMQEFLADFSPNIRDDVYEGTIGKDKSNHHANFVKQQVTESFSELFTSDIRPFNIPTFLALELGDDTGEKAEKVATALMKELGGGPFVELQEAIKKKELTAEQVDALRDTITAEMEALLGPWSVLLVDIPLLSYVEDTVADWAVGDDVEALRQMMVDIEIDEEFFESLCEDQ